MPRYRKNNKKLDRNLQISGCPFCEPYLSERIVVDQTKLCLVTKNEFPYDLWENQKVADHLILVPKRHIACSSKLSGEEKNEFYNLMSKYEKKGYNSYTRSDKSLTKSVPLHHHTHLIETIGKRAWLVLSLKKPHYLLKI